MFRLFWIALINFLALGNAQNLGTAQYCTDLNPQSNMTINKLTGTWFGVEVITHRDRVSSQRSSKDCIYVVITEISQELATLRPPENPREVITQFGPRPLPSNALKDYRFLKLEWIDLDEKLEFIVRYNVSRNGFWLSSAPHEPSHYAEQPSFGAFSGTIQVITYNENYMLLTICESVPSQQLFSIILTRHQNSLKTDTIKSLRDVLRARDLKNIFYRAVCSGVDSICYSEILTFVAAFWFIVQSKWMKFYPEGM